MTATSEGPSKKPYLKPAVAQVRLMVEEAVLAGCKIALVDGPGFAGTCVTNACYEERS